MQSMRRRRHAHIHDLKSRYVEIMTCCVRHNEKDECALRSCKENSLPQCLRCCGERTTNTGATNTGTTGTGKVRRDYGSGIEVVQARAPSQVPVKYAKTTVPRWYT